MPPPLEPRHLGPRHFGPRHFGPRHLGPLHVIGHVRTAYPTLEATPVQSSLNREATAVLEIHDVYADALDGLAGFDFAWLLTWLGPSANEVGKPAADGEQPVPLRQVPFLLQRAGRALGVFAMRGPRRVNPLGLSLVRLLAVDGPLVHFAGVDLLDGTPVVDLKPYVSAFDRPPGEPACGWFDEVDLPLGATPQSLRDPPQ